MRIEVIKNFVSVEEASELNQFTIEAIQNGLFENGRASMYLNGDGIHMVSRFNRDLEYPPIAYIVKDRIMKKFGFTDDMTYRAFNDSGLAVNCSFKGGQLLEHTDARENNLALIRCTVVVSQPVEGGVFHVEGKPVPLESGDLYACLVSEHSHFCTKNEVDTPRIVWQFGFNVPAEDWNSGKIKVQQ